MITGIPNQRLLSIDGGQVTFSYKDYRRGHHHRQLTLSATEFIRRFMMHVLPHGFMRIRYYGFLANANRKKKLNLIRQLLGVPQQLAPDEGDCTDEIQDEQETALEQCPHCKLGKMRTISEVPRPTVPQIINLPLLVPI